MPRMPGNFSMSKKSAQLLRRVVLVFFVVVHQHDAVVHRRHRALADLALGDVGDVELGEVQFLKQRAAIDVRREDRRYRRRPTSRCPDSTWACSLAISVGPSFSKVTPDLSTNSLRAATWPSWIDAAKGHESQGLALERALFDISGGGFVLGEGRGCQNSQCDGCAKPRKLHSRHVSLLPLVPAVDWTCLAAGAAQVVY